MDSAQTTEDPGTTAYRAVKDDLEQIIDARKHRITKQRDEAAEVAARVDRRKSQIAARAEAYESVAAIEARLADMPVHERRRRDSEDSFNVFGSHVPDLDLRSSLQEPSTTEKFLDGFRTAQAENALIGAAADVAARSLDVETEELFQRYGVPRQNGKGLALTPSVGQSHLASAPYAGPEDTGAKYKPAYCARYEEYLATKVPSKSTF